MKEQSNIEEVFKKAFENYEVDPGSNAWSNIQSQINAQPSIGADGSAAAASSSGVSGLVIGGISTLLIGTIAIAGYFYFKEPSENEEEKSEKIVNTKQKEKENTSIQINENGKKSTQYSPIKSAENEQVLLYPEKTTESTNSLLNPPFSAESNDQAQKDHQASGSYKKRHSLLRGMADIIHAQNQDGKKEATALVSPDGKVQNKSIKETTAKEKIKTATEKESDESNQSISKNSTSVNRSESNFSENNGQKTDAEQLSEAIFSSIPNVFTPNQDGWNDLFKIPFDKINHLDRLDRIEMKIFNRTQSQIYEWRTIDGHWDGVKSDGSLASNGVYFYMLTVEIEGQIFSKKSNVTLQR